MNRYFRLSLGLLLLAFASPLSAHEKQAGNLVLKHPWVREMPKGIQATAGYVKIVNDGKTDDRLLGATLAGAEVGSIHSTTNDGGVTKMRVLEDGVAVPAGATVELATGGTHIMFTGIKKPLDAESYVSGSLTFEKAGKIDVEFFVEPLSGSAGEDARGHKMEHNHQGQDP